jgi:Ca2+ transporting ATPase
MFKHIIGQAIFQFIIIITLVFTAERYIPESVDAFDSTVFLNQAGYKWHNGIVGGTIRSGRMKYIDGSWDYQNVYEQTMVISRHFTFIFNTFVMLQVFNFINAKKLHE